MQLDGKYVLLVKILMGQYVIIIFSENNSIKTDILLCIKNELI